MQKLNDEKILGALLAAGSVRKAAKIADVSEATIRNRLNDEAFRTQYEKAKAAAKAVNDFSTGISGILGFDPMEALRKSRKQEGEI